jgi:tRNA G18 (ribose-2'-O)-methylase SpoU
MRTALLIQHIDDLDSPLLDPYRELKRTNLTRWSRWFIGEGKRVVERLLSNPTFHVYSVLLAEKRLDSFGGNVPEEVPILVIPDDLCSQLVGFAFHSGIMACGKRPQQISFSKIAEGHPETLPSPQTLVICPNTNLPDNLGSIIRIAAAFSFSGLILGPHSADPFCRRAIRVSMGNIFELPIFEPDSLRDELIYLKEKLGFELVAAHQSPTSIDVRQFQWHPKTAILLGNESEGITAELLDLCDRQIEIKIAANIDSLNVSIAAGILMYERSRHLQQ